MMVPHPPHFPQENAPPKTSDDEPEVQRHFDGNWGDAAGRYVSDGDRGDAAARSVSDGDLGDAAARSVSDGD